MLLSNFMMLSVFGKIDMESLYNWVFQVGNKKEEALSFNYMYFVMSIFSCSVLQRQNLLIQFILFYKSLTHSSDSDHAKDKGLGRIGLSEWSSLLQIGKLYNY